MEQKEAYNHCVAALRLHFLQGNSQIADVDAWIQEQVRETLSAIRQSTGKTKDLIDNHEEIQKIQVVSGKMERSIRKS